MTKLHTLRDTYALDAKANVRPLKDSGYLVAMPRVARTGIQLYLGSEVGMADKAVVRVFRPEAAVFDKESLASMGHKPVTDDHPPVLVDASNWSQYGKGHTDGEAARDGEFVRVPMMLQDGALISKFNAGKKEISVGYTCSLDFTPGVTADGAEYDAVQGNINVNHIAIVDRARGGEKLRLGDGAGAPVDQTALASIVSAIMAGKVNTTDTLDVVTADTLSLGKEGYRFTKGGTVYTQGMDAARAIADASKDVDVVHAIDALRSFIAGDHKAKAEPAPIKADKTKDTKMADKTIVVDGISVTMDAQTAAIVERAQQSLVDGFEAFKKKAKEKEEEDDKKVKAKDAQIAELTTKVQAADAQVATLTTQLADATLTPAKLDAAVADRARVVGVAKTILGDALVIDGKTTSEMMAQVVASKLGDVAKAWTPEQVKVSFDTMAAGVTVTNANDANYSASSEASFAFGDNSHVQVSDSDKMFADRTRGLQDKWKTGGKSAAA